MIAMKPKFTQLYIGLWMSLAILSCDDGSDKCIPDLPTQFDQSNMNLERASQALSAHIFVDTTASMKGFTVPGSTNYTRALPYLESAVLTGWVDSTIKFFRFGTWVEPIDRTTFIKLRFSKSYSDEIGLKTFIQKAVDYESQESRENTGKQDAPKDGRASRLVVILSDLFQSDSDFNLLVRLFKEKYLKNNLSVGILGFRSEFDGFIYDLGPGLGPRKYKSETGNPDSFRPVYLLALGRHEDIAYYFDTVTAAVSLDAKTIIFSPFLTDRLLTFEDTTLSDVDSLIQDDITGSEHNPRLKQLQLVGNPDSAKFSTQLKIVPIPHTMFSELDQIEAKVLAKRCVENRTEVSTEAQACLDIKTSLTQDAIKLDANLTPKSLPHNGVFLYEVTLRPDLTGFRVPEWCSTSPNGWDMGLEFDGSRTLNLSNLVNSLSMTTLQIHQPIIVGKLYFYLQKG